MTHNQRYGRAIARREGGIDQHPWVFRDKVQHHADYMEMLRRKKRWRGPHNRRYRKFVVHLWRAMARKQGQSPQVVRRIQYSQCKPYGD